MIEVMGKGGIVARVVADSISESGVRLMTYELEFHRYILSEYNTHRMFSRNAASTRAIPLIKMLERIAENPAMPIFYGKNQAGMAAEEELEGEARERAEAVIRKMLDACTEGVKELNEIGLHKQHAGRYLEPWGWVKGVVSFTEYDNWEWLRLDGAAQPEIAELARCMREARDQSVPQLLKAGQWHLPYVEWTIADCDGSMYYKNSLGEFEFITLENAIKVSCARCAAVSYRGVDYGLEKCLQLYDRLVGSEKKHSSALEHCATPMQPYSSDYTHSEAYVTTINSQQSSNTWQEGISHVDRDGNLWSGNFKGWIQYRKTIKGENYSNG